MTPQQFVATWKQATLKERSAAQPHFIGLCRLIGHPTPEEDDPSGAHYTSRDDILLIIEPVLMAPLRRRWASIEAQARELAARRDAASGAAATRLGNELRANLEAELKKRTLTNLYNERPTWLANAHRKLDEAVLAAYGWPADLSDEQILARLLALNLERAAGQGGTTLAQAKETLESNV